MEGVGWGVKGANSFFLELAHFQKGLGKKITKVVSLLKKKKKKQLRVSGHFNFACYRPEGIWNS